MFDIGAGELLVIGIVALVVIGTKELPGVLRQVGKATGKMRQMAGEFRAQFDEAMREAELHDAAKQLGDLKQDVLDTAHRLNPVNDIRSELQSTTALIDQVVKPDTAGVETPKPADLAPLQPAAVKPPEADTAAAKPKRRRAKSAPQALAQEAASSEPALQKTPAERPKSGRKGNLRTSPPAESGANVVALTTSAAKTVTKPATATATKPAAKTTARAPLKLVEAGSSTAKRGVKLDDQTASEPVKPKTRKPKAATPSGSSA